ncbi:MAG TPA: ATP-binding protein [Smithellaceae bacterium]|nr:ATP-binding protein [Smithellaceae bacterium]
MLSKIIDLNNNLTLRVRLVALTVAGLALTMAIWGLIHLTALDQILVDQQRKRLEGVAETISTFYQHFPTRQGIATLDSTLKDHIQTDVRLARIDIMEIRRSSVNYVAGASRVTYEWPDHLVAETGARNKSLSMKLETEGGPSLGLLYPVPGDPKESRVVVVGIIAFSRANAEIMSRARQLLLVSSGGLLLAILLLLGFSYGWLIGRPLETIIKTIDEFQKGRYVERIPIVRRDEWGRLADHFNQMADEIQNVMERNENLTRHLEDRVREETLNVIGLQKQVDDLQQLTALGHLTANLAHDLGTPLHSIAGLARLMLEREGWPPDVAHKLNVIVEQTQRLDHVIQNVRKATRLPEPHLERMTVHHILSETLPLVEPLIQKNRIAVEVRLEQSVASLYADRYRIQTALLNILQNSIEAMSGGGVIRISAQDDRAGRTVIISIIDNGPGIEADLLKRVCDPFVSSHQGEGMRGLGLAIVRDIIKVHNGRMDIQSQPGSGTSVVLYLRMADDAAD